MDTRIQVSEQQDNFETILEATLNGIGEGSRPVYEGTLRAYMDWASQQHAGDAYSHVVAYRRHLEDRELAIGTINRHLSAIRNFYRTATNMGQLPEDIFQRILQVKNIRSQGQKHGTWLPLEDAQKLLGAPDVTTLKGLRDRAILAVMLGCGLRRSEVAKLRMDHLKFHGKADDGYWTIENLLGKHNRVRSIPMQQWVSKALSQFIGRKMEISGTIHTNRVFFSIDRHGNWSTTISSQAVWNIVTEYAAQCGFSHIAPHDLRRTYAELMRRHGAELEEIQTLLGHSSLTTTQRYLENKVDPVRVSNIIPLEI